MLTVHLYIYTLLTFILCMWGWHNIHTKMLSSWQRGIICNEYIYALCEYQYKSHELLLWWSLKISTKHIPVSQSVPVNPSAQTHVYPLALSIHVAPFWQGLLLHSFASEHTEHIQVISTTIAQSFYMYIIIYY